MFSTPRALPRLVSALTLSILPAILWACGDGTEPPPTSRITGVGNPTVTIRAEGVVRSAADSLPIADVEVVLSNLFGFRRQVTSNTSGAYSLVASVPTPLGSASSSTSHAASVPSCTVHAVSRSPSRWSIRWRAPPSFRSWGSAESRPGKTSRSSCWWERAPLLRRAALPREGLADARGRPATVVAAAGR